MKIAIVSGGFDPLHSGHIEYLNSAKANGDILIVLLNSDAWLKNKKGRPFMSFSERKIILENLEVVDEVLGFDDDDLGSCINGLVKIKNKYPKSEIFFCNGGDRDKSNIPELVVEGINFIFDAGGNKKINSSSWILKNWQGESEDRVWGKFFNLYQNKQIKLKELIINSGKGMSLQKHFKRDEIWFVSEGKCKVKYKSKNNDDFSNHELNIHEVFKVSKGDLHQIYNPFSKQCRIIEIQYGEETSEDDIERLEFYKGNNE